MTFGSRPNATLKNLRNDLLTSLRARASRADYTSARSTPTCESDLGVESGVHVHLIAVGDWAAKRAYIKARPRGLRFLVGGRRGRKGKCVAVMPTAVGASSLMSDFLKE
jgi:hypothetical protein